MQLKIMHGKHTTVRCLIMEFVRHYAVWDVPNTCMFPPPSPPPSPSPSPSSSLSLFDMGFSLYALYLCYTIFLIFLSRCHVLGASWKKMRSSQWHNYWVILLLTVLLAQGILNFWQV